MKRILLSILFSLFAALFAQTYNRIVCLSPSGAEIFCAIGAEKSIVARTDFCDYPATLNTIKSIGGFDGKTLSVEKIVATKCDFVYGSRGMHDFLKEPLEKFGIVLHLENSTSLESINAEILYCGKITNNQKNAERLVKDINEKIEVIKQKSQKGGGATSANKNAAIRHCEQSVAIYWEIWNQPLISAGKNSYINELIEIAGGKNIFAELQSDYPIVSAEAILKADPKLIILQSDSTETLQTLNCRPAWKKIAAIKNGNVKKVDSVLFSRPGPRIVQAAEILQKIIEAAK